MKTNISRTALLIATIFTLGSAFAARPISDDGSFAPERTALERSLDRALNRHLSFPLATKEDMTGEVFVSFVIDQEGKVEVMECHAENEGLKDYVLRKLARIDIGNNPDGVWKTTHLRIHFRREGPTS